MNKNQYRAVLNYSYLLDGITYYNSSSSNSAVLEYKDVSLDIKKIANKKHFKPGDDVTYVIIVHNNSNYDLENVLIKDDLTNQKLQTDSINVDAVNDINYSYKENNNTLEINVSKLLSYQTVYISYITHINDDIDNTVNINSEAEVNIEAYKFNSNQLIIEQKYAQLLCQKENIKIVYPNKEYTYELSITNVGNTSATNIDIYDQLPNNYSLSKVTIDGNDIVANVENNMLKIFIQNLEESTTKVISITGMIKK